MSKNTAAIAAILGRPLNINKELALPILAAYAAAGDNPDERAAQVARRANMPAYCSVDVDGEGKATVGAFTKTRNFNDAPSGSIAVIPVRGVMMRESGFSWSYGYVTGTRELEEITRAADQAENIAAIVYLVNSPGGEAAGNESLLNTIKGTKTPTLVHFDGMASAAVYSFIGANEIYAVERGSYFGSIGTLATVWDNTKMLEDWGITIKEIYAPQSTLKNESYREVIDNDNDEPMKRELGTITDYFIKAVQKARPGMKDDGKVFKGQIYTAEEVAKIGAIDGVKPINFVLERAAYLARQRKRAGNNNDNQQNTQDMHDVKMTASELTMWQKIKNALNRGGGEEQEQGDKTANVLASQLEAVTAEKAILAQQLEALSVEKADLAAQLEAANAAKVETEQQLEASKTALAATLATAQVVEGAEPFTDVDALVASYNAVVAHNIELGGDGKAPALPVDNKETGEVKSEPAKAKTMDERYKEVQDRLKAKAAAEAEAKAEAKK